MATFRNPGASKLKIVNCVLSLNGFRSAWQAEYRLSRCLF